MNIAQMKDRVDFYNDRTKSARFNLEQYANAFNGVITSIFKDRTENDKFDRKYYFESSEEIKRELYTLIKTTTIVPVGNVVAYPADYRFFGNLFTIVDGQKTYARPCPMSEEGPIMEDSFRKPNPKKTYYVEKDSGFKILWNGTAFTSSEFTYLKEPQTVFLGNEVNLIGAGGTVAINTNYIVFDDAVYNGVNYATGTVFTTGLVTTLTFGSIMLASIPVDCDFPDYLHDEICKKTSDIMQGTIEDYNKAQFEKTKEEEQ